MTVLFRTVNADLSVRKIYDSDSVGIRVGRALSPGGLKKDIRRQVSAGRPGMTPIWITDIESIIRAPMRITKQESIEAFLDLWQDFTDEFSERRIVELRPEGAAVSWYFDTYPTDIPSLWGSAFPWMEKLELVEPIPIEIPRHPYARLEQVVDDPVEITNGLNDRHLVLLNPGNRDGELISRVTPTGGKVAAVRGGIRTGSVASQEEFRLGYMATLVDSTLLTDTDAVAVAGAMGPAGEAAVVDFGTQETMAPRVRNEWTPDDPEAIEGLLGLLVRIKHIEVTDDDRSKFYIKPYYGFSAAEIAMAELPKRAFDFREIETDNWTEIDLGVIKVNKGAGSLFLDLHAQRVAGDGLLAFDVRTYEPAGVHRFICGVPNFRRGDFAREQFDADELDGNGRVFRETYRLNAPEEYGRTFPAEGMLQIAGTHTVTFHNSLREPDDPEIEAGPNPTEKVIGEVQVWRDTGAGFGAEPWKKMKLRCRKNRLWTELSTKLTYAVSAADEAGEYRYRYQVEFTADQLDGRRIQIHEIVHAMTPALTVDTDLILDAFSEREYVEADGVTNFEAHLESGPIMAPEDESTLVLTAIDLPTDAGYDDVDDQGPLGISTATRGLTVQNTVIPRETR